MMKIFTTLRTFVSAAVFLSLFLVLESGAAASPADANDADRAAITKAAEAFVAAFSKGDAKAVAACWTPDGDFVDESGRVVQGRAAIEADFANFFAENKLAGRKELGVRIEIHSLRFPTADSAIEDGVTSVLMPDGVPPSRARYTNLHVKKDGQWLLASVREAPFVAPNNYEHLRDLDWTIGEWIDADTKEERDHTAHIIFEWTPDQNFIIANRAVEVKGVFLENGSQRIGWDPAAKRIRSWSFETDGGFGEAAWIRNGDTWTIRSSSVLQGGGSMTATNIVTRVDADTITWQSKEQALNGKAIPDSPVIKMKRLP